MNKIMSKTDFVKKATACPERSQRERSRRGRVVSLAMNGVAVVEIERKKVHKLYGKAFKVNKRLKARVRSVDLNVGDSVRIIETRPRSKETHFEVISGEK